MVSSPDHPELVFIQARYYAKGRPNGPPLWLVVHTMEAQEHSTTAENTANYFANPGDGRTVSSHYCCDNNSIVQCVKLSDTAYTVGNTPGNYRGINYEFAGFASQTPPQWGDSYSMAMLQRAAPYFRADAERFGIPLRHCSVNDLVEFRAGITSHNDMRLAFGVTTHTDPGPNFPWDEFMEMVRGEYDMGEVNYKISSADPAWNGQVYLSNRIHRRGPLRAPGNIQGPAKGGTTEIVLTDAMRNDVGEDWPDYLDAVAGPPFPALVCNCECNCGDGDITEHTHTVTGTTGPVVPPE